MRRRLSDSCCGIANDAMALLRRETAHKEDERAAAQMKNEAAWRAQQPNEIDPAKQVFPTCSSIDRYELAPGCPKHPVLNARAWRAPVRESTAPGRIMCRRLSSTRPRPAIP